MKSPTFPTIIRRFYTFSNSNARATTQYKALTPFSRATIYKSMPTIPFMSSFFSSSSSAPKMSYPVQKSDDEWQAVLSKGNSIPLYSLPIHHIYKIRRTIPSDQTERHRSTIHWQIRQAHARHRRLYMRSLRRASLQSKSQIQVRMWMACVLRQHPRCSDSPHR